MRKSLLGQGRQVQGYSRMRNNTCKMKHVYMHANKQDRTVKSGKAIDKRRPEVRLQVLTATCSVGLQEECGRGFLSSGFAAAAEASI